MHRRVVVILMPFRLVDVGAPARIAYFLHEGLRRAILCERKQCLGKRYLTQEPPIALSQHMRKQADKAHVWNSRSDTGGWFGHWRRGAS